MQIKKVLDKSKDYGTIFGVTPNGATYTQDNLDFDAAGKRITPISDEEKAAVAEAVAAMKELEDAEEKKTGAIDTMVKELEKKAEKKEAEDAEKVDERLPEGFMKWTRKDLISYGKNKFNVVLTGNQNQVRAKLKKLL